MGSEQTQNNFLYVEEHRQMLTKNDLIPCHNESCPYMKFNVESCIHCALCMNNKCKTCNDAKLCMKDVIQSYGVLMGY